MKLKEIFISINNISEYISFIHLAIELHIPIQNPLREDEYDYNNPKLYIDYTFLDNSIYVFRENAPDIEEKIMVYLGQIGTKQKIYDMSDIYKIKRILFSGKDDGINYNPKKLIYD